MNELMMRLFVEQPLALPGSAKNIVNIEPLQKMDTKWGHLTKLKMLEKVKRNLS